MKKMKIIKIILKFIPRINIMKRNDLLLKSIN